MGTCFSCGNSITLMDNEAYCPSCGEPPYNCWNCKEPITGETKECTVCHYFICPSCGVCSKDCKIPILVEETKDMNTREKIEYIYNSVQGGERLNCPNHVSISYGHKKLKNLVLRLKGIHTKNSGDYLAFKKRYTKLLNYLIGTTWTVSQERLDGEYGIETREVSNLMVCLGYAIKRKKIETDSMGQKLKEYEEFERVYKTSCPYSNWNEISAQNYCKNCKNSFSQEVKYCPNCKYERGKSKGENRLLITRKSYTHFCGLARKNFTKIK